MADDEPEPDAAMVALRRKIVEIERDTTLSAAEKALRRQAVMSGTFAAKAPAPKAEQAGGSGDAKGASRHGRALRPCQARLLKRRRGVPPRRRQARGRRRPPRRCP